jgi:hypothetical protein
MDVLAADLFSDSDEVLRQALANMQDRFRADCYLFSSLLFSDDGLTGPWAKAWRKLQTLIAKRQGSNITLVRRLVSLADSHEDLDIRQAARDALGCIPPTLHDASDALHNSNVENLLRKLLDELPEQPSARTSIKQRRALTITALIAASGSEQDCSAVKTFALAKCSEVLRYVPHRQDLLFISIWTLAALAPRYWGRMQASGIPKVSHQARQQAKQQNHACIAMTPGWPC